MIAASALHFTGVASLEEARRIANLPPLTEEQRKARRMMLAWAKSTGRTLLLTPFVDGFKWSAFWEEEGE
jgi:hypothetical protein